MQPGEMIAGYEVVDRLGQGGMGEVYLVRNPSLDRLEAMKVISVAGSSNAEFQRRFISEAKTTAALDHPSIVTIYQHGIDGDRPWFTMSYLKGEDLSDAPLTDRDEILRVFEQVASALDYAHRNGVVHRDIKPANILLLRDPGTGVFERAVVVDFGIAKLAGSVNLTATDAFVGTVKYSAPEVIEGKPATARSDQYSLACALYEVLAGRPVFDGSVLSAIMLAHLSTPANPISTYRPDLRALDPAFARALAKNPADRYPDCRTLIAALRAGLSGPGSTPSFAPSSTPTRTPTPAPPTAVPPPAWSGPQPAAAPYRAADSGRGQWGPPAPPQYAQTQMGAPSWTPPPAPKDAGWKIAQSLWVLVPFLTCGIAGPLGFLYAAIRINARNWWLLFGVMTALWIALIAVIGTVSDSSPLGVAALFVLWLAPTIVGLAVSPAYLKALEAKSR